MADREHMVVETQHMRLNDILDFYVAVIIVIIFILVIRKKAKQFSKKREEIRLANRFTSRWIDVKNKDTEKPLTEDTCNICLIEFKDHERVI